MKLPRDLSGADLVKALARIGYRVTRLQGNHSVKFAPLPGGILENARR